MDKAQAKQLFKQADRYGARADLLFKLSYQRGGNQDLYAKALACRVEANRLLDRIGEEGKDIDW